jgi:hypothetical protein
MRLGLPPRSAKVSHRRMKRLLLLILLMPLAGCAYDTYVGARTTVVQNKFDHLTCEQVDAGIKGTQKRIDDLERLRTKAAQEAAGNFIGTAVYGPTIAEARGNLRIYRETHADKKCPG